MRKDTLSRKWNIEKFVPILMCGGLFGHLMNIAHYLQYGVGNIRDVLLPGYDGPLTCLMIYSGIGLLSFWRSFFIRYGIGGLGKKLVYWLITFYIAASIPGHILFLSTSNTAYFDIFPWWFSLIIIPVYPLIIYYFFSLKEMKKTNMPAPSNQ